MTSEKRAPLPSAELIALLPSDGGDEFNRLIHSTSPYLLQHARNPVDWFPWGEEAFTKARTESKPIFLSVGYSACHWCHVMEHESFENKAIADIMNDNYVPIKVDREERPDIDEIYMSATQLMSGHGGWPNSLFLTPDAKPFFAGTYFPPEDRWGKPGFRSLLMQIAAFWRSKRKDIELQAERLSAAMKNAAASTASQSASGVPGASENDAAATLTRELVEDSLAELASHFDRINGGFGSAPKFPPHGSLELLLREYARTKEAPLLMMAESTLTAMMQGGIQDHLGGGFARYSTDEEWLVPHFEKMLYDNAQLSKAYVQAWSITGKAAYKIAAIGIFEWALREMTDARGAFYSAQDADSEGEEGKFYLWTKTEVIAALGEADGELFCRIYDVTDRGNFVDPHSSVRGGASEGANILHLSESLEEIAKKEGMTEQTLSARLDGSRAKLMEIRSRRVRPGLDDKILTSWNGLMISGFAYGGLVLREPRYVNAAAKAARYILESMRRGERLLSTARDGNARLNAYLDDYAFLAQGLLELHDATGQEVWLNEASSLMQVVMARFGDDRGGYYFTSDDHEMLLYRWKDPLDKALPSGNGVAARVLLRLHQKANDPDGRYLAEARKLMIEFAPMMRRAMRGMQSFMIALAEMLDWDADSRANTDGNADGTPDERTAQERSQGESGTDCVSMKYFIMKGPGAPDGRREYISTATPLQVKHGDRLRVEVILNIAGGWHIQSHSPLEEALIATSVLIPRNETAELRSIDYPAGKIIETGDMKVSAYQGNDNVIRAEILIMSTAPTGLSNFELRIKYQPCADEGTCAAPVSEKLIVNVSL